MSGPSELTKSATRSKQVAAIPYRFSGRGDLQVLLVTSRETKRWVIPKGWPWPDISKSKAAAGEAWEEAGVTGNVRKGRIGSYRYDKRKGEMALPVTVFVYLLEVTAVARRWPEHGQRRRAWFSPEKAADAVNEPELKELLLGMGTIVGHAEPAIGKHRGK